MKFKNYKREDVDLFEHCFQQKNQYGNKLKIHIGTDSIAVGGYVHYFTVVAFRHSKTGVHFIFSKETVNSYRTGENKPDLFTRLWRECKLTMEVAQKIVEQKFIQKDDIIIELDYNNWLETISNKLVPATKGWAIGEGYQCMVKYKENANRPDQWEDQIACKAANHLCQSAS